ncbi:MAG: hypothetical protein IJM82_06035 [Synergistaceae bacterium]|nr:hypothetical protein [Synergistaceae bacterium]MBQ6435769.1 hypothetical protein [Synergistaceae bacterium]MBQ7068708.1 hypothetical protein [Synergistaceae bacterium]MBR0079868.1 hypothetical protein [Synergistaceae bacterium]MBR0234640.1 hypothetical protein [Synergistaceae bacterium]
MSDSWLGFILKVAGGLGLAGLGYVAWKETCRRAYEKGKAQGYKEASEEYEAKFRNQAEEFLSKEKEFEKLINQHEDEKQALKEKINAYREEGARLIGEYEGLQKRYNEQNKKLSKSTQTQFSSVKKVWDKLKAA